jgi:hypothetical protein
VLTALAALASALPVAPARAAAPAVPPPFDPTVCQQPTVVVDQMRSPTHIYDVAKNCDSTCKKGERDCESFAKLGASCSKKNILADLSYAKLNCFTRFGKEAKPCMMMVGAQAKAQEDDLATDLETALQTCSDWGTTCESTCP